MSIHVNFIRRGDVFLLKDKEVSNSSPSVTRHNYIIVSDGEIITAMTISHFRNRLNREELIPIQCSNGDECFIDSSRVYTFTRSEVKSGVYHGYIEEDIMDKLNEVFLIKMGLKTGSSINLIKELQKWGKENSDDNTDEQDSSKSLIPSSKEEQSQIVSGGRSKKRPHNKFLRDWTLQELIEVYKLRNEVDKVADKLGICHRFAAVKIKRVEEELEKRSNYAYLESQGSKPVTQWGDDVIMAYVSSIILKKDMPSPIKSISQSRAIQLRNEVLYEAKSRGIIL